MSEMFPTEDQLRKLREHPDDVPVIMLNLMKFRENSADGDGSGWDAYLRYSKATSPLIKEQGGRIIWTGKIEQFAVGSMEDDWDMAAIVEYPSRAAFMQMFASEAYRKASVHRINGVERHVIMAGAEMYRRFGDSTSNPKR